MSKNILLIQDNPADAETIQESLVHSSDDGFKVEWLQNCTESLKRLELEQNKDDQRTDVTAAILLDLSLSDSLGIETFDQIFRVAAHIPILILSASQDEAIAKLAVKRGAQDYFLKDRFDPSLIPKTVESMIERAANAELLFAEKERAQVTLNSIGDAVISTDIQGQVTYLNLVAERMTGWSRKEAENYLVREVLQMIDATTRKVVQNPMMMAIKEKKTVGLSPNCILIRRDGYEIPIEDSTAPIHDCRGQVTGAVMVFHDVSAARAMSAKMSYLAQHDSLTDLPNNVLFKDRLGQAMALCQRHAKKLAVLFLDIDRFKHINDSLGHDIGDRLLQAIVQRLLASTRISDTVSRRGGDEFVILFAEVADAEAAAVGAEKMLTAIGKPYVIGEHILHVTASIGIATYPDDGVNIESIMKNADLAMYEAKDSGRNNYKFFKSEMNVRAVERQFLECSLRQAIELQEFALHYQPKVNLVTGTIIGAEALIRWHHPQRGLVSSLSKLSG